MTDILGQIDAAIAKHDSMERNQLRFDPFGPDCRRGKGGIEEGAVEPEAVVEAPARAPFTLPPEDYEALYGPTVRYNEGGWYEIAGMESWHGSDSPAFLRLLLAGPEHRALHARAQAVLDFVTRNEVPAPPVGAVVEPDRRAVAHAVATFGAIVEADGFYHYQCAHPGCSWTRVTRFRPHLVDLVGAHDLEAHPPSPSWWSRLLPSRRTR